LNTPSGDDSKLVDVRIRRLGSGSPVVLVHGLGVSSTYFAPLAEQLSCRTRLIAPDLPGWGRSDRPDAVLDVAAAADVLAEIIVAEDLGRCALVANSLGCQFVVELADRRADLVAGLVLISPTVDPRFRSPIRQGLSLAVDWMREPPGLWPLVARDYWRMGPARLLATALRALRDRPEEKLPRIEMPVLVLRGDRDATTSRSWAERCARLAPDGTFVPIPGAAHAAHFSHPREVARLVLPFVSELADHRG
jgi:pimeloyl-ACP methyl ester carboxylesterase